MEELIVGNVEVTATAFAIKEACQEEIYLTLNVVHERGDWADKGSDCTQTHILSDPCQRIWVLLRPAFLKSDGPPGLP